MKEEKKVDFIQEFNYTNSFWENTDLLDKHSEDRFDEYMKVGELFSNISSSINDFADSLTKNITIKDFLEKDELSTRKKAFKSFIDFINKIIKNLQKLSNDLLDISNQMIEKSESYNSRKKVEKISKNNFSEYEENLDKLKIRQDIYYDFVKNTVEIFLNGKYKEQKLFETKPNLNNLYKKRNEYKEEVKNCENKRVNFIQVQRNILADKEQFDLECSEDLKAYFNNSFKVYNKFLASLQIDDSLIESINSIDGEKDIREFCEKNRDILSFPPNINFAEYNQNMDVYFNFEVIKQKLKNKNNIEEREFKRELGIEINNFLDKTIYKIDHNGDIYTKFSKIADDILNKKLAEEDYNFVINQFTKEYNEYLKWKKNVSNNEEFWKFGEVWDNRFNSIHIFMNIFNKLRMYNKKMEKKNYDYYVKIMKKILEFNKEEEVDYNLCDLLITLASTFYTSEIKDGKEIKKYISEDIKDCELFQNYEFWVGLTTEQLNEEIIKERLKVRQSKQQKSFLNNINKNLTNLNININLNKFKKLNIPLINKKKEVQKADTIDKYSKLILAKLMSVSYNLGQYVNNSDTLNKALYNIFRFYKISKENRQIILEVLKPQLSNEGNNKIIIDEELLINNKFDNYLKKENGVKIEDIKDNKDDEKKNDIEENTINENKKE